MSDLARRLVQHPRWRWMGGMRTWDTGARLIAVRDKSEALFCQSWIRVSEMRGRYPDLTDDATIGCLWSMLAWDVNGAREESNSAAIVHDPSNNRCCVAVDSGEVMWRSVDELDTAEKTPIGVALAEALLWLWDLLDGGAE